MCESARPQQLDGTRLLRPRDPNRAVIHHERTILVIEDDTEMRLLIARTLERAGYAVVTARSGSDAVDWLGLCVFDGSLANVPALIVSDIRLPDFSGLDLLEVMISALEDVPMVLITGFPSRETYAEAFELGAVRVLEKPFELEALRAAVRSVLDERAVSSPNVGVRARRA
jgi:DNA-binding NtrC family response regulator